MVGQAEARRTRVFLSYSRKDLAFADELIISLESHGFEMVVDREDLFPGEAWEPRLWHFITEADTTVCVVSAQWVASPQCVKELDIAIAQGRRVLPLIIDQVSPSALPDAIARLQFVFFAGQGRTFARGVADLVKALRTDIDWLREQTRLLDRAQEWDATARSAALLLRGGALERALQWLEAPRPEHTHVLPLVAEFVTASQRGQSDEERNRLRGRVRTVGLAGLAAVGLLASGVLYFRSEAERQATNAAGQAERAERLDVDLGFARANVGLVDEAEGEAAPRDQAGRGDITSEETTAPAPALPNATGEAGLVARLSARDASIRVRAGQEVAEAVRRGQSQEVLAALVSELEGDRLVQLGASGRFNVLYMLNVYDDWPNSPYASQLASALQRIEARMDENVHVGPQTQDCIDRLQRKLAGERNVGDRCGGR
jgi:hypothetical protein